MTINLMSSLESISPSRSTCMQEDTCSTSFAGQTPLTEREREQASDRERVRERERQTQRERA